MAQASSAATTPQGGNQSHDPRDRPVLVEANGKLVSAVQYAPKYCSGTGLWRGFTVEVLDTPASETPPTISLVRHLICTIDSPEPLNFHWKENGREYKRTVGAGDHLIRSQQEMRNFRWDSSARALILGVDPATMRQLAEEILPEPGIQLQEHYGAADDYMHKLMRALAADLIEGSPTGRTLGESLCTSIAIHSLRRYGVLHPKERQFRDGLSNGRLRWILDYIDSRLSGELSLFDLAKEVGISPFYLTRLFRTTMKITVHQYVIQQRIERAKHLLRRTNLDVFSIAKAVGFERQSHFSQTFRGKTGVTPLAFRTNKSGV